MKKSHCPLFVFFAAVLSLFLSAAAAHSARTVAFVAGIGAYDESDLDKLHFTARDARDVFEQLRLVADLDEKRSRLILAAKPDDPWVAGLIPNDQPYRLVLGRRLTKQRFEDEFHGFIESLRDDDTAIIYLGGHGTVVNQSLVYLPSDYSVSSGGRYVRYDNLLRNLRDRLAENNRVNVKVVFLGNMCGAGNAQGIMSVSDPLEADFVREWLKRNSLGLSDFAFIPATAPNQNTFEKTELDGGRSIFAHHLIRALKGRGNAEGEITSDWLFKFIDKSIPDQNLPRNDSNFSPDIVIARTHHEEAEGAYLLGVSLLAAAQATGSEQLDEIAEHSLNYAKDLSSRVAPNALAWLGLRAAAKGQVSKSTKLMDSAGASAFASDEVRMIRDTFLNFRPQHAAEGIRSPRALKESLEGGRGYFLVSMKYSATNIPEKDSPIDQYFESFSGLKSSVAIPIPSEKLSRFPELFREISALQIRKLKNNSSEDDLLIVTYDGVSAVNYKEGYFDLRGSKSVPPEATLFPLTGDDFISIANAWDGPVLVVYSAPFGGMLDRARVHELSRPVSLFLATQAVDGMSFHGSPEVDTSMLMAQALQEGVDDLKRWTPAQDYLSAVKQANLIGDGQQSYSVDIPKWVPDWRVSVDTIQPASQALLNKLANWPLALAVGCKRLDIDDCDLAMPLEAGNEPLANALKLVGRWDVASGFAKEKREAARQGYVAISNRLGSMLDKDFSGAGVSADTRVAAQAQLYRLYKNLLKRAQGVDHKDTRTVRFLDLTVSNYKSPFVPDLLGPDHDRDMWVTAIENMGLSFNRAEGWKQTPNTVEEVRDHLAAYIDSLGPDDLTIFYVAGRGIEHQGKRYLALPTAYTESPATSNISTQSSPARRAGSVPSHHLVFDPSHFISVEEVAKLFDDRWLLAIWDTQFSEPTVSAKQGPRPSAIYDRHLHAAWPSVSEDLPDYIRSVREMRPEEGFAPPGRQLHFMLEGRLNEVLETADRCGVNAKATLTMSPLSSAIISTLEKAITGQRSDLANYRNFAEAVQSHACIQNIGRIAVQGSLDLPLLASGPAAEHIIAFANGAAQRDVTLGLSIDLADRMVDQFNRVIYRVAALAGRVERLTIHHPVPEVRAETALYPAQVHARFREIREDPTATSSPFAEIVYDYGTRPILYLERGRLTEAQQIIIGLRGTPVENSTVLLNRLLDLTRRIAKTGVADALESTRSHVHAIEAEGKAVPRSVTSEVDALIAEHAFRSSRNYAIHLDIPRPNAN